MMQIYELLLKGHIGEDDVRVGIGQFLGIDASLIGPTLDFLDPSATGARVEVGLDVEAAEPTYPTTAQLMVNHDIGDERYLALASALARRFGVPVAIGDFTYEGQDSMGQYIVLTPDGLMQQGVEGFDADGNFVIVMESQPALISEFLKARR